MDTGSYMANQMDDLITAGIMRHEQECEELAEQIETYIKECGYTWKVDDILKEYREKYKQGYYVSYTCKEIIKKFEERLIFLHF
jgi:hypothetical protein